jgi:prepilin-type N-terminal cleavage/methylation domain-containing protein
MKKFLKKNRKNRTAGRQGLTLVETIVAIAVLSITIVASTAVSATYMRSRTSIKRYQANNEEISMALNYLAKDIRMSSGSPTLGLGQSIDLINNASGETVRYSFNATNRTLTRREAGDTSVIATNVSGSFFVAGENIKRITIRIQKQGTPEMTVQTSVSMRTKYLDEN